MRLIRLLLAHGDYVVAALPPHEVEHEDRSAEFRELVNECKAAGRKDREGWRDRIRSIRCDGRSMGQCEAAVAEAREHFGRIDILLCCTSEGTYYCFFPLLFSLFEFRLTRPPSFSFFLGLFSPCPLFSLYIPGHPVSWLMQDGWTRWRAASQYRTLPPSPICFPCKYVPSPDREGVPRVRENGRARKGEDGREQESVNHWLT